MSDLYAFIGGSGLYQLDEGFQIESEERHDTPFGSISAALELGYWKDYRVAFLPRHGRAHRLPPHRINYRANLWALKNIGVTHIIAVNTVGGIHSDYVPGVLCLPDQIIDYTSNRKHSFFDSDEDDLLHVDFTWPYTRTLGLAIIKAAKNTGINLLPGGTYGCTNGPRLETAAEIRRLKADGCDMVGMTGMPEAALARELNLEYSSIALVVNRCAGLDDSEINLDQIKEILALGIGNIRPLLLATLKELNR